MISGQRSMRPFVGIPTCARDMRDELHHTTPARYAAVLTGVAGVVPLMIPALGDLDPETETGLLNRLDGLLLSGSPSNVDPALYGASDETPDCHDTLRDKTILPLIRAAIGRGMPVLGICRGVQELNVALGGTLHQRVHSMPGRADHRGGPGNMAERYRPKHKVHLAGTLARLMGRDEITVNSVHGQAVDLPAPNVCVEAMAEDGTIEAIRVMDATAFAMGVQWHPEWNAEHDPNSQALFRAFGDACRGHASGLRRHAA